MRHYLTRSGKWAFRYWLLLVIIAVGVSLFWFLYLRWFRGLPSQNWVGIDDYFGPVVQQGQVFRPGKTLWDWLALLVAPAVIALGVAFLNQEGRRRETALTLEQSRDAALSAYLEYMSKLLLDRQLRQQPSNSDERKLARARTLAVLPGLDGNRKATILRFLYESDLIGNRHMKEAVVDLIGADLSGVNMKGEDLGGAILKGTRLTKADFADAELGLETRGSTIGTGPSDGIRHSDGGMSFFAGNGAVLLGADLSDAYLRNARLTKCVLRSANLARADLRRAKLIGSDMVKSTLQDADLSEADLSLVSLRMANLQGAIVTDEQLKRTSALDGSILPDGTVYDGRFDAPSTVGPREVPASDPTTESAELPIEDRVGCSAHD